MFNSFVSLYKGIKSKVDFTRKMNAQSAYIREYFNEPRLNIRLHNGYDRSFVGKRLLIGAASYVAGMDILVFDEASKLVIGSYCSISENIEAIMGGGGRTTASVCSPTRCLIRKKRWLTKT